MPGKIIKLLILISAAVALPLSGIALTGRPVANYLEFPPVTRHIQHAPFTWPGFIILSFMFLTILILLIILAVRYIKHHPLGISPASVYRFPFWGYAALVSMALFWITAWTRFGLFAGCLHLTFFPLWLSFIILINALKFRRTGSCMLTRKPRKFILLFPVSMVFWWYFEYINGFVHNWYYVGTMYDTLTTFLLSSLAFSTVLPAVLSTHEYLISFNIIRTGFDTTGHFRFPIHRITAAAALIISCAGLFFIGVFPDYLFFMTWLSPLMLIISLQVLFNEKHILSGIETGDWSIFISASIAALICGIFWEMWNYYSFPKWEYSVPFVNGFRIFEMPVMGFLGYIPFGLFCVEFVDFITNLFKKR